MLGEIANHLWQSTLFAAVIAFLCFLLRKDGAHVRYSLWWIASVKFLIPFSVFVSSGARTIERLPPVIVVAETVSSTAKAVTEPFTASGPSWSLSPMLLALWAIGSAAILGRWLMRAAHLRALVREAERDPQPMTEDRICLEVRRTRAAVEPGVAGIFRPILLLPRGIEDRLSVQQLNAVIAHEFCHVRRRDNLTAAVQMLTEAVFWFHRWSGGSGRA